MYKFIKEEDSRADQLYIRLEYMSGDADAYDYEEYPLGDIKFSNYKEHLDKIDELVKEYKLIQKLTVSLVQTILSKPDEIPKNFANISDYGCHHQSGFLA